MLTVLGLLVSLSLLDVAAAPIYAPLIGAVALVAWHGGVGPSLVSIVLGFAVALWLLVDPRGELFMGESEDVTRWWVNLAVTSVIAGVSCLLRVRQHRAAARAVEIESSALRFQELQELAGELAGAASTDDIAHVLTERGSAMLHARGASLGLVEGDELVLVEPEAVSAATRLPGGRIRLDDARVIAHAAREGETIRVESRQALEAAFPTSALLLPPSVRSAIAVPLRRSGNVIGALGLVFDHEAALDDEAAAVVATMARFAEQALERARLFEREQEAHEALDRILQVAPKFHADTDDEVARAICREARTTFGSDYGVLWRIHDESVELVHVEPPTEPLQSGQTYALDDFPGLQEAVRILRVSFIPDVLREARGQGLAFVQQLGIRSSLRMPIVIGASTELVLVVSWQTVIADPDPSTLAILRRFADQAGLALEQLDRRRAEAELARRAAETQRLQQVTAALSRATTPADVGDTCLEHALSAVGAEAGFVVLASRAGTTVEFVSTRGYADDELDAWRAFTLDDDVPFSRAMASGEAVWALSAADMESFTGLSSGLDAGWITIPLATPIGVRGALHVSLREPKELGDADRLWLQAMVSQCSQALERSRLFEDEQFSRRRSEELQNMTAALSNALTRSDVADIAMEAIVSAVQASGVAVAVVEDRSVLRVFGARGYDDDVAEWLEADIDTQAPATQAIGRRRARFFRSLDAIATEFPDAVPALSRTGHASFLFTPMVTGRQARGVIVVSWEEQRELSDDEIEFVGSLAGQTAQALERAGHYESEQTIAETLQRSVLPVSLPRVDGVQLAARYLPGSAELDVGGDWFDALRLPDGKLGLVVGDVVGKGVQAAASMAQLRNALRAFSSERLKPATALARLNRLADEVLDTTFATIAYAVLDPSTGVCRLASAGHPPPVVAYPDGRVEFLEGARGLPLGTGTASKYRQEVIELPAGSVLVMYTDGLVERRGQSIDVGLSELLAAIRETSKDPERLLEHVLESVVGESARGDDIAMLAVRLFPVAPRPLELRVQGRPSSMGLVRDALRTWLETAPVTRAEAEDIVLATWEACANAIEHPVETTDELVTVRATLTDSMVRIEIEDSGRWASAAERTDRGLGLVLMRSLSSAVDIDTPNGGTRVVLEKRIAGSVAAPVG